MSQVVNLLRERYPQHLSDSNRVAKIRDKMASTIEKRNLLAGVQTGEAPGCTLGDLRVLVQETAVKGVQGLACCCCANTNVEHVWPRNRHLLF